MNYIIAPIQGLFITVLNLFCPILVLFALPFTKWNSEPSWGRDHTINIVRGNLPNWLSWFSTPDEELPGGMYEESVKKFYLRWGKWATSWYWLGVRNCLFGMALSLGKPTTDYIPDTLGYWERDDIWRYSKKFGIFKFLTGYKVYKLLDGTFRAAPCFSVMVRR